MKKKPFVVYYKPGCSKCRTLLEAMDGAHVQCELVEYLEHPPTVELLQDILQKTGLKAKNLVRTSEPLYSEKFAGKKYSDKKWLEILVKNPVLLQRPIVMQGDKAWIARDAETIEELLSG